MFILLTSCALLKQDVIVKLVLTCSKTQPSVFLSILSQRHRRRLGRSTQLQMLLQKLLSCGAGGTTHSLCGQRGTQGTVAAKVQKIRRLGKCTVRCKNFANWQHDVWRTKRYDWEKRAKGANEERGNRESEESCICSRIKLPDNYTTVTSLSLN